MGDNVTPDDQLWFGIFRLGVWPDFYPGVQFSRDPGALDQFFRQMVPNTGPYDVEVNARAVVVLRLLAQPTELFRHDAGDFGGIGGETVRAQGL